MRERLIELLKEADEHSAGKCITSYDEVVACDADFLISNGVIVLPCKVGDTVYIIDEGEDECGEPYVLDVKVLCLTIGECGIGVELSLPLGFRQVSWCVIGETVFLTREEAEKAIAERKQNERKYLAVSIKHTAWRWKFGKPCVLWGYKQTKDDEKRCFSDYTQYPNKAEVYSMQDWLNSGYGSIIKMDEPVHMEIGFCDKWKKYDTVLIDKDEYIGYCKMACLPIDPPKKQEETT
jgi:hypothetical protein